jgi:hypothetical protein
LIGFRFFSFFENALHDNYGTQSRKARKERFFWVFILDKLGVLASLREIFLPARPDDSFLRRGIR